MVTDARRPTSAALITTGVTVVLTAIFLSRFRPALAIFTETAPSLIAALDVQ